MKLEDCVDCRHSFIFHNMRIHPSNDDKRIYCRICEKICEDCWNDALNPDEEKKLWKNLEKDLY